MYHAHFGLREAPFSIAVNPRFLYLSPRHRDALAHLLYGVGAGGGFILLTGEVGTGKTTLNRCFLEQLPDRADVAIVLNPALDVRDLLASVCDELAIALPEGESVAGAGLKALTDALHRFLLDNHRAGRKTVLIIDEAQHLSFDVLEQIRLLTNLETNEEKLLHIILIGQPELAEKLGRPELRQLNQRVTARFELAPLSPSETAAYVRHRLHVAGAAADQALFDKRLLADVHRASGGVPRLINLLCDRMLLGAYGNNLTAVSRQLLRDAQREVLGSRSEKRSKIYKVLFAATGVVLLGGCLLFATAWLDVGKRHSGGSAASPRLDGFASADVGVASVSDVEVSAPGRVPKLEQESDTYALVDAPSASAQAISGRVEPRVGTGMLWALYGVSDMPALSPCALRDDSGLACSSREWRSWDALLRSGRPALLDLVDSRRLESRALLIGVSGDNAVLGVSDGFVLEPLETLAQDWTGLAWQLQRPLPGFRRPLSKGDVGEDVRRLAQIFADIDGEPSRLADLEFNAALEVRVRLFQREAGLIDDGLAGDQTLQALALAAGVDVSLDAARSAYPNCLAASCP